MKQIFIRFLFLIAFAHLMPINANAVQRATSSRCANFFYANYLANGFMEQKYTGKCFFCPLLNPEYRRADPNRWEKLARDNYVPFMIEIPSLPPFYTFGSRRMDCIFEDDTYFSIEFGIRVYLDESVTPVYSIDFISDKEIKQSIYSLTFSLDSVQTAVNNDNVHDYMSNPVAGAFRDSIMRYFRDPAGEDWFIYQHYEKYNAAVIEWLAKYNKNAGTSNKRNLSISLGLISIYFSHPVKLDIVKCFKMASSITYLNGFDMNNLH